MTFLVLDPNLVPRTTPVYLHHGKSRYCSGHREIPSCALELLPDMPLSRPLQAAPSPPLTTSNTASTIRGPNPDAATASEPNEAATKLAEAIDDFLGDLEKKFKGISDEILTKCE